MKREERGGKRRDGARVPVNLKKLKLVVDPRAKGRGEKERRGGRGGGNGEKERDP